MSFRLPPAWIPHTMATILLSGSGALFWWLLTNTLRGGGLSIEALLKLAGIALFLLVGTVLTVVGSRNRLWLGVTAGLILTSSLFFSPEREWLLPFIVLGIGAILIGARHAWRESEERIRFSPERTARALAPFVGFTLAVMIGVTAFLFTKPNATVTISRALVRSSLDLVMPRVVSQYRSDMTVAELLNEIVSMQDVAQSEEFLSLPRTEQERLVTEAAEEMRLGFEKSLGRPIPARGVVSDAAAEILNEQLKRLTAPYQVLFPYVNGLTAYVVARTLFVPVAWLALPLTAALVSLLRALGVLKTSIKQVEKTVVTF
ncbi:MAG: hypothetical protein HY459_01675 [Parcubacteria group bacterium]|nr:hypothetical protein [Parcubacteria group bacterium]